MTGFRWEVDGVDLAFTSLNNGLMVLRADFPGDCIVRVQSEYALSTEEEDDETTGIVPFHLAYRVEGGRFLRSQSAAWVKAVQPQHFLLITPGACIDVLSAETPKFNTVMPRAGFG
jgi:hypothetical protein